MTPAEVIALMQTSRDENEWNNNYDEVCKRGITGGRWWDIMMMSGIADKIRKGWIKTSVSGLLADIMPHPPGEIRVMELLPPTEAEIAEIKARKQ